MQQLAISSANYDWDRPTDSVVNLTHPELRVIGFGFLIMVLVWVGIGRVAAIGFFIAWLVGLVLYYAVKSPVSALCVFAFTQPFEQIFFTYGVGRYNSLGYLAMAVVFLSLGLSNQFSLRRGFKGHEFAFLGLILWCSVTVLWATNSVEAIGSVVTLVGSFACLLMFEHGVSDGTSVKRVVWFYIVGTIALGTIGFTTFQHTAYVERGAFHHYDQYINHLLYGINLSSGEFARSSCSSIIGALFLWEREREFKRKLLAMGCAILLGFYTLLTVRRASTYGLLAAIFLWLMLGGSVSKKAKRAVMVVTLCAAAVFAGQAVNDRGIKMRLVDYTFGATDAESALTGRVKIWDVAWDLFEENPVTGVGVSSFMFEYNKRTGDNKRGLHSGYLEFLIETGLIGFALFLWLLLMLAKRCWEAKSWRSSTMGWWLLSVLTILAHNVSRGKEFWIFLGLSCALASIEKDRESSLAYESVPFSRRVVGPEASAWRAASRVREDIFIQAPPHAGEILK